MTFSMCAVLKQILFLYYTVYQLQLNQAKIVTEQIPGTDGQFYMVNVLAAVHAREYDWQVKIGKIIHQGIV